MTTETEDREAPRVSAYGNGRVTITGLTEEEIKIIRGAIDTGNFWIRRGKDGRIVQVNAHDQSPDPVNDEEMHPFWRPPTPAEETGRLLFSIDEGVPDHSSPAIWIQHLCGYGYTPEWYKKAGETLRSFGFQILRSPRGSDGRFWEIWYLPGIWASKDLLKDFIASKGIDEYNPSSDDIREIASFIFGHAPYGTLDSTVQRMCMAMPD